MKAKHSTIKVNEAGLGAKPAKNFPIGRPCVGKAQAKPHLSVWALCGEATGRLQSRCWQKGV